MFCLAYLMLTSVVSAAPISASTAPGLTEAWVDEVGWAASKRDLKRFMRSVRQPTSVFRAALRGDSQVQSRTLYAAEIDVHSGDTPYILVRETVFYTNTSEHELRSLVLRLFPLGGEEGSRRGRIHQVLIDNKPTHYSLDGSVFRVGFRKPLKKRKHLRLLIEYAVAIPKFFPAQAPPTDVLSSLETGAFGSFNKYIHLAHALAVVTPVNEHGEFDSRPLPAMGEHSFFEPSNFHLLISHDLNQTLATTGVVLDKKAGDRRESVEIVATDVRDVAIVMGEGLRTEEVEVAGTRIAVHYPEEERMLGRKLLSVATEATTAYVEMFGPLGAAEIDLFEGPVSVALGLEFPQLMVIDMSHKRGGFHDHVEHEWTIAHEIAHQWWGMEVGSDSAGAPWLDEALANHTAALFFEQKYGRDELESREHFTIVEPLAALKAEGRPELPANLPADSYDLPTYAAIVYGRGSLFFDRVRKSMGDEAYFTALRDYYERYRGATADAEALLETFRRHSKNPDLIDALFERWIDSAHGYEDLLNDR